MLDVKFIRENKELVEKSAKEKGYAVDISELIALDDTRKAELVKVEELRKKRNEIAAKMKGGKPDAAQIEAGKAVIIAVNKWDEVSKDTHTIEKFKKDIYNEFPFATYAPIVFISAKTGQRVNKLFEMINNVASQNSFRVSTAMLNRVINEAIAVVQPPSDKGKRLKIFYGTQASTKPPTFVIFVNKKELFHFSYERYIVNCIRNNFGLEGTSVRIICREKNDDYEE